MRMEIRQSVGGTHEICDGAFHDGIQEIVEEIIEVLDNYILLKNTKVSNLKDMAGNIIVCRNWSERSA